MMRLQSIWIIKFFCFFVFFWYGGLERFFCFCFFLLLVFSFLSFFFWVDGRGGW